MAAVKMHSAQAHFARFDIEDFFGSVNQTRLTRCLKEYFPYERAREMAEVSTVRHPMFAKRWVLPYGFVQSPLLASLALDKSRVGTELRRIHEEGVVVLSVYVDDIILSGEAASVHAASERLVQALPGSKFAFNASKCQGPGTHITAFNIDLSASRLEINQDRLDAFADALNGGPTAAQRLGILTYVRSVNATQAAALA